VAAGGASNAWDHPRKAKISTERLTIVPADKRSLKKDARWAPNKFEHVIIHF
jgi:hypothetical protein